MDELQQEQAKKLLKAAFEILEKCDDSSIVLDVLSTTAIWDGVEGDGYCLKEEIGDFLIDL